MNDPISAILGQWSQELNTYSALFRILLSVCLAAVIGCERSSKRHSAGLRTFILVSLVTTVIMLMDIQLAANSGLYLLSCAAVIGVSIISVNSLLLSSRSQIKGLTTAAGLWGAAIIGLAIGAGYYTISLIVFAVLLSSHFEIHLELKDSSFLHNFVTTIRRLGLRIDDIEANPAYANSGLSVYSISISIHSKELKKYKTHTEIVEALRSLEYIYHIEEMLP